jgi:hypothetical protein
MFTAKHVPLLPAPETTLLYFVGHLSQSVSYATVKTYLASMSYLHIIFQLPIDMGTMQLLEKCLKGLKCLKGEKREIVGPSLLKNLHVFIVHYVPSLQIL